MKAGSKRTTEQKEAAGDLLNGLWDSPSRRARFTETLASLWDDFKSEPQYEELRSRLARVMRGPRR